MKRNEVNKIKQSWVQFNGQIMRFTHGSILHV